MTKDNIDKLLRDLDKRHGSSMAKVALGFILDPQTYPSDKEERYFEVTEEDVEDMRARLRNLTQVPKTDMI